MKDRAAIRGCVKGRIIRLDSKGLAALDDLRARYPKQKKDADYVRLRDELLESRGRVVSTFETHNIVTNEGDAMIADLMAETPAQTKVNNTNGHIEVGTGWTGTTPKSNASCNTPTGSPEVMDATYPKLKGTFGNTDDNVVQYQATFEAGDLNQTGIDEAALLNNSSAASAECLAYAQIDPAKDVTSADTLQVLWELTILGA